jgi:hypothetical protein
MQSSAFAEYLWSSVESVTPSFSSSSLSKAKKLGLNWTLIQEEFYESGLNVFFD